MQYRMKTHQLEKAQVEELLNREPVGVLATVNEDGSPYATPVHFLYREGRVYIHGLPAGQKLDNIKRRGAVCLTVYRMEGLLLDGEGKPCDTNTKYRSVILQGSASLVTELEEKRGVLAGIVAKYTPHLASAALPENMVKGTGVISIEVEQVTGKYWE